MQWINKGWYLVWKWKKLFFPPPLVPPAFVHLLLFFIFGDLFPLLFQRRGHLLSDRDRFQLGTLSHSLNSKATGYQELSDWPTVAPDPSVRNVEVIEPVRTPPSRCTPPKTFSHPCKHNVILSRCGVRCIIFVCHGLLSLPVVVGLFTGDLISYYFDRILSRKWH